LERPQIQIEQQDFHQTLQALLSGLRTRLASSSPNNGLTLLTNSVPAGRG
jgi:hypothetical protein